MIALSINSFAPKKEYFTMNKQDLTRLLEIAGIDQSVVEQAVNESAKDISSLTAARRSAHQAERLAKYQAALEKFREMQIARFGKLLEPGDLLGMSGGGIINEPLSSGQQKDIMVVYSVGQDIETYKPAVGLFPLTKNHPKADPENNYILAYGITRLRNAKLVGHEKINITSKNVRIHKIEPLDPELYGGEHSL
jgi:hypothetical protein